jgi:hypothetical protein
MLRVVALVATALGPAAAACAQGIPFSQRGAVYQRVGYTDLTITYSRPVARGRTLFGGVVTWGRVWNPGADSATTITISRDVAIEGRDLAAGRYTIWLIPRADSAWTAIFSRAVDVFHTPYPGEEHDALRVAVTPQRGSHVEVLAFYFPVVAPDSAVLRLHWGETMVDLRVRTK